MHGNSCIRSWIHCNLVGLVTPILEIADAIDTNTVTATLVAKEILKVFLKELLAGIWFVAFFFAGKLIID